MTEQFITLFKSPKVDLNNVQIDFPIFWLCISKTITKQRQCFPVCSCPVTTYVNVKLKSISLCLIKEILPGTFLWNFHAWTKIKK